MARASRSILEVYAHQELPFEKLVEELKPERDLRRNPIVQVLFVTAHLHFAIPCVLSITHY